MKLIKAIVQGVKDIIDYVYKLMSTSQEASTTRWLAWILIVNGVILCYRSNSNPENVRILFYCGMGGLGLGKIAESLAGNIIPRVIEKKDKNPDPPQVGEN